MWHMKRMKVSPTEKKFQPSGKKKTMISTLHVPKKNIPSLKMPHRIVGSYQKRFFREGGRLIASEKLMAIFPLQNIQ